MYRKQVIIVSDLQSDQLEPIIATRKSKETKKLTSLIKKGYLFL